MLDQLRQGAQGWVSKLLMAVLVVSFGIWGISGSLQGYHADQRSEGTRSTRHTAKVGPRARSHKYPMGPPLRDDLHACGRFRSLVRDGGP